jgi:hypothetical protein
VQCQHVEAVSFVPKSVLFYIQENVCSHNTKTRNLVDFIKASVVGKLCFECS